MARTFALVILTGCGTNLATTSDAPAADVAVAIDAAPDVAPAATTIPIAMVTLPNGNQIATVQVSIGGGAPFTAELDTGSVGLRMVDGTVPDGAWTIGTQATSVSFGSGVIASGVIATAEVTLGGLATTGAIAVEDITMVACTSDRPSCAAAGVAAADFRFDGMFPAILGVGLRSAALASPLAAIGTHQQYTLSLPPLGGTAGVITIDPDATALARFAGTEVALPAKGTGFDDTQVPFCVNALCVVGLLDTGQPAMVVATSDPDDLAKLGVPAGSTTVPAGTAVTVIVGGNRSWSFEVGNPPVAGVDLIRLDGTAAGEVRNLGITPYHQFDVAYDYAHGTIGIAPK